MTKRRNFTAKRERALLKAVNVLLNIHGSKHGHGGCAIAAGQDRADYLLRDGCPPDIALLWGKRVMAKQARSETV